MPKRFDVAVVGGGAAGLAAAIGAARRGGAIVVCDRMPRLGKKILVTGGGRCNLLNENLDPGFLSSTSKDLVSTVLGRFGKEELRKFFKSLGLETCADETGRIFPVTNQASSVLKVLELEIRRLGVVVELNFEAAEVKRAGASFSIAAADGRKIDGDSIVLAGGGKAYPSLGSNGSCYRLAQSFGHQIVPPVPGAVPLVAKDRMCHILQGQKIRARASSSIAGKTAETAEGEVLFTQYGLSGTAILDVSESLSVAFNRDEKTDGIVIVDMVPFMTKNALTAELAKRIKNGWAAGDLAVGILPDKFAAVITDMSGGEKKSADAAAAYLAAALKEKRFQVQGTRGWNEAEFTCGGVDAREVDPLTLESNKQKGLYFAGEILDVQGKRGGYNLAWAWASGFVAGLTE